METFTQALCQARLGRGTALPSVYGSCAAVGVQSLLCCALLCSALQAPLALSLCPSCPWGCSHTHAYLCGSRDSGSPWGTVGGETLLARVATRQVCWGFCHVSDACSLVYFGGPPETCSQSPLHLNHWSSS